MNHTLNAIKKTSSILILCSAFLFGAIVGKTEQFLTLRQTLSMANAAEGDWGLSFQTEGEPPVTGVPEDELQKYDAHYLGNTEDKTIYLTFDCGYESGDTPAILDALKKHNVSATFFVVGNFIEDNPDLVKRMVKEGHTIGNHTYTHPDMSQIASVEAFEKELSQVESLYQNLIGEEMPKYYRPPQGKYSSSNLKMAQELGYHTFFWSLAYVDWQRDNQPSHEEAFEKLLKRIHSGAIVLLHNTSRTNGEIMDELLTKWEEMGYQFHTLDELILEQT